MIEITKACIVALMKARNSLVVSCREKKKVICYITKSGLDVQFVKKIPFEMVIGEQMKEEGYDQN